VTFTPRNAILLPLATLPAAAAAAAAATPSYASFASSKNDTNWVPNCVILLNCLAS